jgi:hypothetical protein
MSKNFKDVLKSFDIDEKFTKETRKAPSFNHVKNNIPMHANYNQMADILFLPETKEFKYCLIVVDLATNKFDLEPLKEKNATDVLKALMKIYKRKIIKEPYGSLATDSGTEFKGVFNKWLYDENILHKTALPNRHSQMSNVESLNKQLGRLIMGHLNSLEQKSGKVEKDWLPILPTIRKELNKYREIDLTKVKYPNPDIHFKYPNHDAKYNIGDIVYEKLDWPEDALGNKQPTSKFRAGDQRWSRVPKKILKVFTFNDAPFYRYQLESLPNVSYSERELMPAGKEEKETKYKVKSIIGKKKIKGKVHYLIHWKGYKKSEATWEPAKNLIEDGLENVIDEYENQHS